MNVKLVTKDEVLAQADFISLHMPLNKVEGPTLTAKEFAKMKKGVVIINCARGGVVSEKDLLAALNDGIVRYAGIDVFENEVPYVRVGQQVEIRSAVEHGALFNGRISFVYPFHDPKTHTVKARVEMPNSGHRLKPDMFVNAIIRVPLVKGIVVPVTAVIDTGKRQVVWVETSPGMFEPRDVQVGERVDDKVQILSGIKTGDKVAVSGGYLIDSESQLKGAGGQDHSQHTGGAKPEAKGQAPAVEPQPAQIGHEGHEGHDAPPAQQQPAKKGELKMDDMKM